MPDCIMFHFAGCRKLHIQLCVNDRLLIPNRFCDIVTIRIYNAASAAANHLRQT